MFHSGNQGTQSSTCHQLISTIWKAKYNLKSTPLNSNSQYSNHNSNSHIYPEITFQNPTRRYNIQNKIKRHCDDESAEMQNFHITSPPHTPPIAHRRKNQMTEKSPEGEKISRRRKKLDGFMSLPHTPSIGLNDVSDKVYDEVYDEVFDVSRARLWGAGKFASIEKKICEEIL